MQTISFEVLSPSQREQAATLLIDALAHVPSAWKSLAQAREEVEKFFNPERLAIAAVDGERLIGWIGAIRESEFGWELHPLVVDPLRQGRGVGTRLVRALEEEARRAGACTIWLGSDDDFGGTNLFGVDLYPDVLARLQTLTPVSRHPFTFYQRLGYAVVGVLPDVDGVGKHDILMAKRI